MKSFKFFVLVPILFSSSLFAKTYYISNTGNDSNNGITEITAFQTLTQVALVYQVGDTILFKRGDIFREETDTSFLNVYIDAYGNNLLPIPVISGSEEITGWSLWKDNIYVADFSQSISNLFVDNKMQTIARYPNSGWLRITGSSGSNTLLTDDLNNNPNDADDYWNGGELRWRRWSWWFERYNITDYVAGGKITFSGGIGSNAILGWGFYLDNKLEELDTIEEWFQDNVSHKIYMIPPEGKTPADLLIEGNIRSKSFSIGSSIIKNICFRQQSLTGLSITGKSIIANCVFENIGSNSGGQGISATWNIKNSIIENCLFKNNINLAISWNEDNSHGGSNIIRNNRFLNIGAIPCYGGSGSYHAAAVIILNGENIHIENNYFENIGYAGVILAHQNNFCEYNVFKHCMATLNDGGAIYTNCDRSTIKYNLIFDTEGDLESSGPWSCLGHGIWPEFLSNFKESDIENNTVVGSGGYGLFLPNNYDCIIKNNTFFNNTRGQMDISGTTYPDQNHVIENNILFGLEPEQKALVFENDFDYGLLNNNYYGNLYDWFPIMSSSSSNFSPYHFHYVYSWGDCDFKTDITKRSKYRTWNQGYEMLIDTSFDTGTENWILDELSSPANISLNSQGKLNGNCLEVSYNDQLIILEYKDNINMYKDQFYELSFSYSFDTTGDLSSSSERSFKCFINNAEDNHEIKSIELPVITQAKDVKMVFQSDITSAKAQVKFFIVTSNTQNSFYLDNVSLKPVYTHERDYSQEAIILYNDSMKVRKFLPSEGKWKNIDGIDIADSISLPAFLSIILIRNEEGQLNNTPPINGAPFPNSISSFTNNKIDVKIFPNPFSSTLQITSNEIIQSIELISINSKQIIISKEINDKSVILYPREISPGNYIIKITDMFSHVNNYKVVKN